MDLFFNLPAIEQVSCVAPIYVCVQNSKLAKLSCLYIYQYKNTPEGKPTSWVPFMNSLTPKFAPTSGLMKSFLWTTGAGNDLPSVEGKKANTNERRSRFAQDASIVAAWDFERIIPSHGDTVEKDAKKMWLEAFSKVRYTRKRAMLAERENL